MSIQNIKAALNLPELIGEYVKLRPVGKEHIGLCPFHDEGTPSLRVHTDYFKCFGCGAGGDCFTFVSMIESVSVGAAIHILSDRTGIPLDGKPLTRRQRVYDSQEKEFAEWWQKTTVRKLENQLTAYCIHGTEEDCESIGVLMRQVRAAKGQELRALALRAGDQREWREDRDDAENITWWCVACLAS